MRKMLWAPILSREDMRIGARIAMASLLFCLMGISSRVHAVAFTTGQTDYTDVDVEIAPGTTTLTDTLTYTIRAATADILVTMTGDSILQGDAQLRFIAEKNQTITVLVSGDLMFAGASAGAPLFLTFGGLGTTRFEIVGGYTLAFGPEIPSDDIGEVKAFVIMEDPSYPEGDIPTLSIVRSCADGQDLNININIGQNSLLSYLSDQDDLATAEDQGNIDFDPGNVFANEVVPVPGLMVLNIQNGGALVTTGCFVAGSKMRAQALQFKCDPDPLNVSCDVTCGEGLCAEELTYADVDLTVAAGYRAITSVHVVTPACTRTRHSPLVSYLAQGGLRVINDNTLLSELLIDPYGNLGARQDDINYNGTFNGIRYGFVLGANGVLSIGDGTFVDYIVREQNVCPDTIPSLTEIPGFPGVKVSHLVKERNPAALIVDGNNNPAATPAEIRLGVTSGLFFRATLPVVFMDVDPDPFVVPAEDRTPGVGQYVFVVEAPLNVHGQNDSTTQHSKIEIFSLQVTDFGGPLFPGDNTLQFPLRTFNREAPCDDYEAAGCYLAYDKAAFLINDCVSLYDASLDHTDALHKVCEKNDVKSEPTYVGGEKWFIMDAGLPRERCDVITPVARPHFSFYNSRFNIHTDVALTGMDLRVPNLITELGQCQDNVSRFVYYQNGIRLDNGTGRNMILGTLIGSTACDHCSIINRDAHIDVMQEKEGDYCFARQELLLDVAPNSPLIIEQIPSTHAIKNQTAINSIYLGYNSNVSIGCHAIEEDDCLFEAASVPTVIINGNFFAIDARGGAICDPTAAHITGQGGIFVDKNGLFTIGADYRASLGVMVTRSLGGQAVLPTNQVVFEGFFGIADWRLNLSDEMQQVLIDVDERISNYTLYWLGATRDYDGSSLYSGIYYPYQLPSPNMLDCPPVVQKNINALPTIKGTVEQFQIQGARIGDEANILIDGGDVEELVFVPTQHAGDAPAAIVVLQNGGRVGLGSTETTPDSLYAATTLGINGITIIADAGGGIVRLNDDMVINNHCALVRGPNFGADDTLLITSDDRRILRVTQTGSLDLQSFSGAYGGQVVIGGEIQLVMEAGSSLFMGDGSTLVFANEMQVVLETAFGAQAFFDSIPVGPIDNTLNPLTPTPASAPHNQYAPLTDVGNGLANTDAFRTKFIGMGTILLKDDAQFYIDKGSFVGVETYVDPSEPSNTVSQTSINIILEDNAKFSLGGGRTDLGGSLQVGNTEDRPGHTVDFSLTVNGVNASFRMNPQAFFGLNAGIVDRATDEPNGWIIDVLYNVGNVNINLIDGLFEVADIYSGDDVNAQLFVLGQNSDTEASQVLYDVSYEDPATAATNNANIHGGGNFVRLIRGPGAYSPIVLDQDNIIDVSNLVQPNTVHPNMRVGILASLPLLDSELPPTDATTLFEALKVVDALSPASRDFNLGDASNEQQNVTGVSSELRVGAVVNTTILRQSFFDVTDTTGSSPIDKVQVAADVGAVSLLFDFTTTPPSIASVTQL
jgi:hypothetical protein